MEGQKVDLKEDRPTVTVRLHFDFIANVLCKGKLYLETSFRIVVLKPLAMELMVRSVQVKSFN